jgi:hypothetical protein
VACQEVEDEDNEEPLRSAGRFSVLCALTLEGSGCLQFIHPNTVALEYLSLVVESVRRVRSLSCYPRPGP